MQRQKKRRTTDSLVLAGGFLFVGDFDCHAGRFSFGQPAFFFSDGGSVSVDSESGEISRWGCGIRIRLRH